MYKKSQKQLNLNITITNLLKLITGFELEEEKIFRDKDGTITKESIIVRYPPNLAAIKYYLDSQGKELGFGKVEKIKEKRKKIQPPNFTFIVEDMSNGGNEAFTKAD